MHTRLPLSTGRREDAGSDGAGTLPVAAAESNLRTADRGLARAGAQASGPLTGAPGAAASGRRAMALAGVEGTPGGGALLPLAGPGAKPTWGPARTPRGRPWPWLVRFEVSKGLFGS